MTFARTIKNINNSSGFKAGHFARILKKKPKHSPQGYLRKGNMWDVHSLRTLWSSTLWYFSRDDYGLLKHLHLGPETSVKQAAWTPQTMLIENFTPWNCSVLMCWFCCYSFLLHHHNHHDPSTITFIVLGYISSMFRALKFSSDLQIKCFVNKN